MAHRLGRDLKGDGLDALDRIPCAPMVTDEHRAIVSAVLRLMGATCLVRSAVLQRWDADHGHPRSLLIGVTRRDQIFAAHAWLEGERAPGYFVELHRRAAPTGG